MKKVYPQYREVLRIGYEHFNMTGYPHNYKKQSIYYLPGPFSARCCPMSFILCSLRALDELCFNDLSSVHLVFIYFLAGTSSSSTAPSFRRMSAALLSAKENGNHCIFNERFYSSAIEVSNHNRFSKRKPLHELNRVVKKVSKWCRMTLHLSWRQETCLWLKLYRPTTLFCLGRLRERENN